MEDRPTVNIGVVLGTIQGVVVFCTRVVPLLLKSFVCINDGVFWRICPSLRQWRGTRCLKELYTFVSNRTGILEILWCSRLSLCNGCAFYYLRKFPKSWDDFCVNLSGLCGDLTMAARGAARFLIGLEKFYTDVVHVVTVAAHSTCTDDWRAFGEARMNLR